MTGRENTDYHKLIILNQIYTYLLHLINTYKIKEMKFSDICDRAYFNNSTIDKNIYWNELKLYRRKVRQITSYYNFYLKHIILEANTFSAIPLPCLEIVSQFL